MRGEHGHTRPHNQGRQGSSPHARGAPATALVVGHVKGIIPACAGSTSRSSRRHATPWDHPRMRGEHRVRWSIKDSHEGSSPHARGALISSQNGNDSTGIIPACAGSTAPIESPRRLQSGSSPHARGALRRAEVVVREDGIIPACAGSTRLALVMREHVGDHPRMRGEHPQSWQQARPCPGSSPHARGALSYILREGIHVGIIPACAGSTLEYLRLCPGLKRITLTLPITSEAGKWTNKHPNDQLMPRAFRPSR